jgi:hypothetical protein
LRSTLGSIDRDRLGGFIAGRGFARLTKQEMSAQAVRFEGGNRDG